MSFVCLTPKRNKLHAGEAGQEGRRQTLVAADEGSAGDAAGPQTPGNCSVATNPTNDDWLDGPELRAQPPKSRAPKDFQAGIRQLLRA